MYSKTDLSNYLARHLTGASEWRRIQAARFPYDKRNEKAAEALRNLSDTATLVSDEQWRHLQPLFNPTEPRWCDMVGRCSRDVGFRSNPQSFEDYVQALIEAVTVSA
jgi:hypothetical protein